MIETPEWRDGPWRPGADILGYTANFRDIEDSVFVIESYRVAGNSKSCLQSSKNSVSITTQAIHTMMGNNL